MSRFTIAIALSHILTVTPMLLVVALVVTLATDSGWWWSIGIVAGGYAHALVSFRLEGFIHDSLLSAPMLDSTVEGPQPSVQTPSQLTFLQSADPRAVPHRRWLQLFFPTILLGLAIAGQLLSVRGAVMLLLGFGVSSSTWLVTSLMLMEPMHRQIERERQLNRRQRLVRQTATWTMFAIYWLVAVGALVMWSGSSRVFATIWGAGLLLGAGLALWKRPLVWEAAPDEPHLPVPQ